MAWDRQITIKSPAELEIMRTAGIINAEALAAAHAIIRPGVSTADLNAAAEEVLKKYGVYSPSRTTRALILTLPAPVSVSMKNWCMAFRINGASLRKGISFRWIAARFTRGLWPTSAFTAGVGELSPVARKLLETTEKALYAGIDKMVAGNHVGDVSAAVQNVVDSRGFHVTREYTGHGVGRAMHEGPQVPNYGVPGRGMQLRVGMTIALEPMVLVGTPHDACDARRLDGMFGGSFAHRSLSNTV